MVAKSTITVSPRRGMPVVYDRAMPDTLPSARSPRRIVLTGFASMGVAMGIGRFAFTPLLPLMQQAQGLSLSAGTWLATVNYLGYLLGSVAGVVRPLEPATSARIGLVAVAASTLGMAVVHDFNAWLALRFVAGIASALVLLGVSGSVLVQLAALQRSSLGGWVFGGVGFGIAMAGAIAFVIGTTSGDPVPAWAVLGLVAAAVTWLAWRPLGEGPRADASASRSTRSAPLDGAAWLLVVCYGVTGFGYIVPATFLPAVARGLFDDPAIFSWVWPVFGVAAALSTISVFAFLSHVPPRVVCAVATLVMAFGVALPAVHMSIATLIVSAICVGGTFIVTTLSGIQEARRTAAPMPARLIAAMTSAFALGQLIGPLLIRGGSNAVDAMRVPSTIAAVALVAGAVVLLATRPGTAPVASR